MLSVDVIYVKIFFFFLNEVVDVFVDAPSVCLVVGEYIDSVSCDCGDCADLRVLSIPGTCPVGGFFNFAEDVNFVANGECTNCVYALVVQSNGRLCL
jgi:hypothetical protein